MLSISFFPTAVKIHFWSHTVTHAHDSKLTGASVSKTIPSTVLASKDIGKAWLSKAFSHLILLSANKAAPVTWIRSRTDSELCWTKVFVDLGPELSPGRYSKASSSFHQLIGVWSFSHWFGSSSVMWFSTATETMFNVKTIIITGAKKAITKPNTHAFAEQWNE